MDGSTDNMKTKDADVEMKQSDLDLNGDRVCSVRVGQQTTKKGKDESILFLDVVISMLAMVIICVHT